MLNLDWAAVRNGVNPCFSHQVRVVCSDPFFECQGLYPHWHSSSVMQSLWNTVYGRQKRAKVREFMYGRIDVHDEQHSGRPSVSAKTIAKVEQEQEMLEDRLWQFASCVNRSLKSVRVRLATWQESSVTRVYEKYHSTCKSASIVTMIMSKNSWSSSLSINVTVITNKCVSYAKRNW